MVKLLSYLGIIACHISVALAMGPKPRDQTYFGQSEPDLNTSINSGGINGPNYDLFGGVKERYNAIFGDTELTEGINGPDYDLFGGIKEQYNSEFPDTELTDPEFGDTEEFMDWYRHATKEERWTIDHGYPPPRGYEVPDSYEPERSSEPNDKAVVIPEGDKEEENPDGDEDGKGENPDGDKDR
jgi:hypothetical protein